MKKNTFFLTAMLAVTLAFGLAFVGCDTGNSDDGGEAAAIAAIIEASTSDSREVMRAALENNASALGLNLTAYNTLDDNGKNNVADYMQYDVQQRLLAGNSVTAAWIKEAFDDAVSDES